MQDKVKNRDVVTPPVEERMTKGIRKAPPRKVPANTQCTYTHLLHAHFFLYIFMRVHIHAWLKVMKKVFVACVSSLFILMFHPSLLFFHTHFDITFLSIFLPNFPVLKAQDIEMFGYLAKSDANTGYEPKQFDKITFVDNDTMLIDDPDLDEISDFSKNTRDNTGMFGVPSMFETSVSHVSHGDFALQIEDKRKHASANRLLDRGRERKKKRRFCDQCCRIEVKEKSTEQYLESFSSDLQKILF